MAFLNHMFLGILILQIYVHAAPSDVSKLEDIAKVAEADSKPDAEATEVTVSEDDSNSTDSPRQKRYYNPYGYGFPPINPVIYPNYNRRDEFTNPGNFGYEDPLIQIHRRVQEIADIVRQPPPPQIPHVPIFYPVLFIPQFDCRCNPTNAQPSETTPGSPNVTSRFPDMEDERQNWGFVVNNNNGNNNNNEDDDEEDYSRPISFDPIKLDRPNARPPPPVEHGTVQDDASGSRNPQQGNNEPRPPSQNAGPPPPSSSSQGGFARPPPPSRAPPPPPPNGPPTPCDGAILTCCHRPQVVYDCFAIQGCPSFTSFGNPCDSNSVLRVIQKFQQFYGARNG
ncbi:uncharacterized protein LOC142973716 [Anticarsia gemmatalis]|uniref:uncharacterized protein LOC142973716 n=1 Tax=Anticarsia gemmatalis TaxID=129554 RepID=UPI003F76F14E